MRKMRFLVFAASLALAGCFDFTADSKVRRDGTAMVDVEIAVSMQLAGLAAGLGNSSDGSGDILKNCGQSSADANLPPGVRSLKTTRGTRGEMVTCTAHIEVDDPIKAVQNWKGKATENDGALTVSAFQFDRLNDKSYRLAIAIKANPQKRDDEKDKNPFVAMLLATMANHFVTISISADRIENATGEVAKDGRRVTWKLPIVMLLNPPVGFTQEIRADIVYDNRTWFDKLLDAVGLGPAEPTTPQATTPQPQSAPDTEADRKNRLIVELATSTKELEQTKSALVEAQAQFDAVVRRETDQRAVLEKITITKSRFWYQEQRFGNDQPIISFDLKNQGSLAIKRIFIEGILQTPGRSVPWLKESFNHDVRGGVEPNESRHFDLSPNMFSEWGKVPKDVVAGAVLTLNLMAIEDAAGKKIGGDDGDLGRERHRAEERKKSLNDKVRELEAKIADLNKQLK